MSCRPTRAIRPLALLAGGLLAVACVGAHGGAAPAMTGEEAVAETLARSSA